jgi:hypothetical protein
LSKPVSFWAASLRGFFSITSWPPFSFRAPGRWSAWPRRGPTG